MGNMSEESKGDDSVIPFESGQELPHNATEINEKNSYILNIRNPKYYLQTLNDLKTNNEESMLQSMNLDQEEVEAMILKSTIKLQTTKEVKDKMPTVVKTALSNNEITEIIEEALNVDDFSLMKDVEIIHKFAEDNLPI